MRETKIVATIGPASESPRMLERMIRAGVDVVRLNFSHGDYAEFEQIIRGVRKLSKQLGRPIPILQDLQGPKLRVGEVAPETRYRRGDTVTVTTRKVVGDSTTIPIPHPGVPKHVSAGDVILLRDDQIELKVVSSGRAEIKAKVIHGGSLVSHQGFAVPGADLALPPVTAKDKRDLVWGLQHGVDWVGVSLVRSAADVERVRTLIERTAPPARRPKVMSKIEKREAVGTELPGIVAASDGVMVARGDLGVEVDPVEVPFIQKEIIHQANRAGKPVVTATQMLESMVEQPHPTRAEISDIANAVLDGSDAVMLSEESAVGKYPVEAVRVMRRVVADAERHTPRHAHPSF